MKLPNQVSPSLLLDKCSTCSSIKYRNHNEQKCMNPLLQHQQGLMLECAWTIPHRHRILAPPVLACIGDCTLARVASMAPVRRAQFRARGHKDLQHRGAIKAHKCIYGMSQLRALSIAVTGLFQT